MLRRSVGSLRTSTDDSTSTISTAPSSAAQSDTEVDIPSVLSLGGLPTPLLDLAAERSDDEGSQSSWPESVPWHQNTVQTKQVFEPASTVTGYEDSVPAKQPSKSDVSGYEDAVPSHPTRGAPKQGMELEPSNTTSKSINNNNAPVQEEKPKHFGPQGLPHGADSSREVAHPPGWWERRAQGPDGIDRTGKYPARLLDNRFEREQFDASSFRNEPHQWDEEGIEPEERTFTHAATQHWNPETIGKHKISIKNGKMCMGGELLDTRRAKGVGAQVVKDGDKQLRIGQKKYIFSMNKDGDFIAADAWAEHQEVPIQKRDGKSPYQLRMVNHSSLLGGEAAAASGELLVEDGTLKQASNVSGHYTPNSEMTTNALKEWQEKGVDLHNVAMRMVRERGEGPQMHVSARELLAVQAEIDARKAKKTGNVNNNGPASATQDGKKDLFANMELPPKTSEKEQGEPIKEGKIDLFAALEQRQALEAQFDDAVDLITFRRQRLEEELLEFVKERSLSEADSEKR